MRKEIGQITKELNTPIAKPLFKDQILSKVPWNIPIIRNWLGHQKAEASGIEGREMIRSSNLSETDHDRNQADNMNRIIGEHRGGA